jgi:3-oxoacyl-[acyl-carrier protein] reductase
MLKQKGANIILIGSATSVTGSGGGLHYAASKVAQYGLLKGLSYELLSRGIRTNIITPHIIDTPMLRKRYPDTPEVNEMLAKRTPIGRIGLPSDIANIALFLASDKSGYICGADIVADGGALYYMGLKK